MTPLPASSLPSRPTSQSLARRVLEKEKGEANVVAFQWQNEAKLIETELQSSQDECDEAKRKAEEAELLVCTKDEKISSLVLMLQEALERENEEKEKAEILKSSGDRERQLLHEPETPSRSKAGGDLTTPPPVASHPPLADESEELSFWAKDLDGRTPREDAKNGASVSVSVSASLAKRVLITWDRTPVSRSRAVRAGTDKSSRTVSYSAFLMTVRTSDTLV